MCTLLGVILVVLVILNIVLIIANMIDGISSWWDVDYDISLGKVLLFTTILLPSAIILNAVQTNPFSCFMNSFMKILNYKPFNKRNK